MEHVTSIAKSCALDRFIAVSNRLLVVFEKNDDTGDWSSRTGSGRLVSALMRVMRVMRVLRDRGGIWVGWAGVLDNDVPLVPCFQAIAGRDFEDFPTLEDYVPGPPPKTQILQSRRSRSSGESV